MVITPWDGGTKLYEQSLDVRGAIHETVAANIANEETPGYRAMHLPFKEALQSAVIGNGPLLPMKTHAYHLPVITEDNRQFLSVTAPLQGGGPDQNTVNLEEELTRMAENNLMYMAVAQFLAGRFDGWRSAINEGR
jgi:flagellar basal-body rod protein FlgB